MGTGFLDLEAELRGAFLHPGGLPATRALIDRLRLSPGNVALEIGCGTGATTALLAREGAGRLVAFDRSPAMLTAAHERLRAAAPAGALADVAFVRADAGRGLPFADASFDAILAESVVALLDAEAVIRECARLLRPGGRLALNERVWKPGLSQAQVDEINAYSRRAFGIPAATARPLDHAAWTQLLRDAGLVDVWAAPLRDVVPRGHEPGGRRRLARYARHLRRPRSIAQTLRFKAAARRHPEHWASLENWLFVARKHDDR